MEKRVHRRTKQKRISALLLGLAGILVLGGILLFFVRNQLALEQPMYYRYLMAHYKPTIEDSGESSTMQLRYITNAWDKREIDEVVFEDQSEIAIKLLQQYTEMHGIYKVATVTLYMEWKVKNVTELPEETEIRRIQVRYTDGTVQKVEIGKISIYSGTETALVEAYDCEPLWESYREQRYEPTKDIVVRGISEHTDSYLKEADLIDSYSLTIKDKEVDIVRGSALKKGDLLTFAMTIKGEERKRLLALNSEYDYYEIEPKILVQEKQGKEEFVVVYNPPIMLEFGSYREVRTYIKQRQEREQ